MRKILFALIIVITFSVTDSAHAFKTMRDGLKCESYHNNAQLVLSGWNAFARQGDTNGNPYGWLIHADYIRLKNEMTSILWDMTEAVHDLPADATWEDCKATVDFHAERFRPLVEWMKAKKARDSGRM